METTVHPVDERLPLGRLTALGLQHVLVMYAGAVAVPLIVGRALNLTPDQVAKLISADLFVCGLVTLIQALGATRWFGIKLPVMMGVTMFVQQKITPSTMDPAQAKVMLVLPVVFAFFMAGLPAGLTLYIFVSALFGVFQQMVFMRPDKVKA